MDVNLHIYLKRLREFFENDKQAREDMFGQTQVSMEEFFKMVAEQATINIKKNGDPMLSGTEMLEIVTDLALKDVEKELDVKQFIKRQQEIEKVFVHVKEGFPPFCLN
tara:strand:- start:42 stop:365 length:324 start_codon:yes stop_codon:yes gene_type:complete